MSTITLPPELLPPMLVLSLRDVDGRRRRLTIHDRTSVCIDSNPARTHDLDAAADGSVRLAFPSTEGTVATQASVRFRHLGDWSSSYNGYESLWQLLMHYPHDHANGQAGAPIVCRLEPGVSWHRLTILRELPVSGHVCDVTFGAPTREDALVLARDWMRDRAAEEWAGPLAGSKFEIDPPLFFTPLLAGLFAGQRAELALVSVSGDECDGRRHVAPLRWLVRRTIRRHELPPRVVAELYETDDQELDAALWSFLVNLRRDGPHWS